MKAVLAVVLAASVLVGSGPRVSAAMTAPPPRGSRTYRPPVVAPITDSFRPPSRPWLPGNRGIEYATVPGTLVGAIGPGVVVFAGPVAGALYVTVLHPDHLRSSYSFLAVIRVVVGERVQAGQVVGVAGARLHLGVRRGSTYLDPAGLWGHAVEGGRVHLVPVAGGAGDRSRRSWGRPARVATLDSRPATRRAESQLPPGSFPTVASAPRCASARIRVSLNRREEREHVRASRDHEAVARRRCALRAPDPSVEPEDEAVHLR